MTNKTDKLLDEPAPGQLRPYIRAVEDLFAAAVLGDRILRHDAVVRMAKVAAATAGVAEVLGATEALQLAAGATERTRAFLQADAARLVAFAEAPLQSIVHRVTFEEAVQSMVDRTPKTLRRAAERTAQRISQLYGEGINVAFARSAEASVTRYAHDFIVRALREGIPEGAAGRRLAMGVNEIRTRSAAWSESYARMAFRTNVNTAVSAGRFRQVQDPDIRAVVPAMRYTAVGDGDTRPNHKAADGVILTVDNPAWGRIAPPMGYNCRCQVDLVTVPDLRRTRRISKGGSVVESRIPAAAKPDDNFRHGGRPDLMSNKLWT
jgi:SPP1 gp7 family putative phage head morphogenesis protein